MKKFLYFIWDLFVWFIEYICVLCLGMIIILLPLFIGQNTSWHWVVFLSFMSIPYGLISMVEWNDKIGDWFEQKGTIGKEIESGI
jgi:hypothetical protein